MIARKGAKSGAGLWMIPSQYFCFLVGVELEVRTEGIGAI